MNTLIYNIYYKTRKIVERIESSLNPHDDEEYERLQSWKTSIEILELSDENYKIIYERDKLMQDSFTFEQKDFICSQIGDWYLKWKDNLIVDGNNCQHCLGYAKEELKKIICGE